ncbi:MAG: flavin reductase [Anaerolinea sp.]|nr:flavin reductase [Anaerolinea sp.]
MMMDIRDTLRFWASGVAVVATADSTCRAGMTVSAFNSLSLTPPMILVCLQKDTRTAEVLPGAGCFTVSILGGDQSAISDRFAGRVPLADGEDRFDGLALTSAVSGVPILADAIAWLDCKLHTIHDGSTHWIVIGEVIATGRQADHPAPLLYFDRNYHTLTAETTIT